MPGLLFLLLGLLCFGVPVQAQPVSWPDPESEQLYQSAENALMNGAYSQAISGFQQLLMRMPGNPIVRRNLSQALLRSGNAAEAETILSELISDPSADAYTFVLAAQTQTALGSDKQGLKRLNLGLDKYPQSGLLYFEKGKYFERKEDPAEALKQYVAGIHAEPVFHLNYYEAARSFLKTDRFLWGMIYAEMFINLESETPRSKDVRKMLVSAYKRFFFTPDGQKNLDGKNDFQNQLGGLYLKFSPVVTDGINPETITMLHTRLALEWEAIPLKPYSSSLIGWYDELIREGHFDAYNQWLLGPAGPASDFEAWKKFHPEAIPEFEAYRKKNPYQPQASDPQPQDITHKMFRSGNQHKR